MFDLIKLRLAAGVQLKPEHFVESAPKKILKEERHHGRISKFWVVLKPKNHRATFGDIAFEVTNLSQLAFWMNGLKNDPDAHSIIKNAQIFSDRAAAKAKAHELIAGAVSKYHDKLGDNEMSPDKEKTAEEEETIACPDEEEEYEEYSDEDETIDFDEKEKTKIDAISESQSNFDDEANSVSWTNDEFPVNAVKSEEIPNAFDDLKKIKDDPVAKVSVPASIKTALKDKISELEKDFQKASVRDINSVGYYPTAIEFMQRLLDRLNGGTVEDIKGAQVELTKVSSPFLHAVPNEVVLFIEKGGESRTLKDLFTKIKTQK